MHRSHTNKAEIRRNSSQNHKGESITTDSLPEENLPKTDPVSGISGTDDNTGTEDQNTPAGSPPAPETGKPEEAGANDSTGTGEQSVPARPSRAGPQKTRTKPQPKPRLVERATALYALDIPMPPTRRRSRRKETLMGLHRSDPEIPYEKAERANRDLVCSLMERQDRMNEEIFERIIDLEYILGKLDEDLAELRNVKGVATGEAGG